MPKVTMYTQEGTEAGDVELNDTVFGIEPNETVLHESVLMQRASKRQGTHAVKNRGEVRGGGKKPWRQKGTGRARHGSIRSPIWVGGGVTFGPTPRKYGYNMPKKVRKLALKSALSTKVRQDNAIVIDEIALDEPKTKEAIKLLDTLEVDAKALIVVKEQDENLYRATNNLQNVKVVTVEQLNVLDLLEHDKLILTKDAAEKAGEVLS